MPLESYSLLSNVASDFGKSCKADLAVLTADFLSGKMIYFYSIKIIDIVGSSTTNRLVELIHIHVSHQIPQFFFVNGSCGMGKTQLAFTLVQKLGRKNVMYLLASTART